MREHLEKDLKMSFSYSDPCLYFIQDEKGSLKELVGLYVDDTICAGTEDFLTLTNTTMKKFQSRDRKFDEIQFTGIFINGEKEQVSLHQSPYIELLEPIPSNSSFKQYASSRAKLAWLTHTRPDISCLTSFAAQITEKSFSEKDINDLNRGIRHLKLSKNQHLMFKPLDMNKLVLKAYADSSFANNTDLTCQLGHIIVLSDYKQANILSYASKKGKRVVRSILAGETHAFAEAFDISFTIKKDLERILNIEIPLHMFTDSKQLFDVITKNTFTAEKRLMIDVYSIRNAFNARDITNVGHVKSENNPADPFTKLCSNKCLTGLIENNETNMPVEQWVFRIYRKSTYATLKDAE